MSSASLAILGDYVPFGIGQALGLRARGNSIDNTLRIGQMVRSDWVLLDVPVHQVVNGFGYGDVHLWSESGALPGTASQSTICAGGRTRSDKPDVGSDAVGQDAITVSLDGAPQKLDDFEELARTYGIVELQRTGRIALPKLERDSGRIRALKGKAS